MKELVEKAITNISASAADKSITLNYYIDNQVDTIIGNPITIEELFNNLLTNALKYTPPGGMVELRINKHDKKIMIEVSDNGLGIPKEEQENVFDEFYRASNVPKDIKSGSGLGLSIVKQIVENHKGSIKVESEPGIWTRFTIILPLNASEVVSYY
jgi:signal transduction histidine kinase